MALSNESFREQEESNRVSLNGKRPLTAITPKASLYGYRVKVQPAKSNNNSKKRVLQ